MIDLEKTRNSTCACPFKADKPCVICKHMVALYFQVLPEEADRVQREHEEWEAAALEREQQRLEELEREVNAMSIEELRERVLDQLWMEEQYRRRW